MAFGKPEWARQGPIAKVEKARADRVLRDLVQVTVEENQKLEQQVRAIERHMLKHSTRSKAAEEAMVSLNEAVRVLAAAVSADTTAGKKVRAAARTILERAGIKPPGTLGSSREVKKRRRRGKRPPAPTSP